MYRVPRFERGGCRRNSCRERHFSPCSPTRRGICLKSRPVRVQILPWGLSLALVAQTAEAAGLNPVKCRCESDREHRLRPCSPTAETSASKAEQCRCESCRGHQPNVNRTSEPGFFAKEIVAHFS